MATNPPSALNPAVDCGRGTPASIDIDAYTAPVSPASDDDAWPMLVLDSGVNSHMVGDPMLLSNLRDVPAGTKFRAADGTTSPVTKIGDIEMTTSGFRIPGVSLVPGLEFDVISVRELARQSRIRTCFDGDRAMLYAGHELVGVAVAQENLYGLYVLQFLRLQPERFTWRQFLPLRVHKRKQLRLLIHIRKQLRLRTHTQKGLLPMHGDNSSSSSLPSGPPKLVSDSGASSHMVSDTRLLSNIRDAPAGQTVVAADGNTMPITKVGDIHIQGLTIPDIRLVSGLEFDGLISIRKLARESKICTWFLGDRAKLYAGPKLVGVALAEEKMGGLYVLRAPKIVATGLYVLRTPKIVATSSR